MMRLVAHFIPLIVGTFIIGAGIAILNVVLPGIIKDQFPERFGFMTSVYTTSMSLFAALASGLSVPLAIGMNLGWKITLAIWAIPVFIAILVWGYLLKFDKPIAVTRKDSPLNNKKTNLCIFPAWQIALFLGLQSFLFYFTITWLPDILHKQRCNKGNSWVVSIFLPINRITC